jgi:DNA polymerase-3 subunit epsilon
MIQNKLFVFDLETTGTDPKVNGIHQISGKIVIGKIVMDRFNFRVRPYRDQVLNLDALAVGNVTIGQLESYDEPRVVYKKLIQLLGKYVQKYDKADKMYLCGFNNAAFDNQFLREFFRRNDDVYFGSWFWSNPIDVYVLAGLLLFPVRHEMPNFQLHTVAKYLSIKVDESRLHDAEYDVDLTYQIYQTVLAERNPFPAYKENKLF